jgi:ABC-type hemin transport system ATPase subunit
MLECVKHWIKTGLDQPVEGEEDEEVIELSPEELAQVEVDWDELTSENLAEHVRRLAQNEELDGSFSREELFAMGSIPLLGADEDSDLSLSDVDDVDDVGNEDE